MKKGNTRSIIVATVLGAALAVPFLVQTPAAQAQTVKINGQTMRSAVQPIKRNGRTLVAMRPIFEGLGATVQWDSGEQSITAKNSGVSVMMKIGSPYAVVDGKMVKLDQAPMLYHGSTMVPLRFVSEAMGASVNYNAQTHGIDIDSSRNSTASALVTLNSDKTAYIPREPIKLAFTAPVDYKGHIEVEMVRADIPAGNPKVNAANRLHYKQLGTKTQGVLTFKTPNKLGKYEFRAQDAKSQLASKSFEVVATTGEGRRKVWVDKKQFGLKERVIGHFTSVPFQTARISLVSTDVPRGNPERTKANDVSNQTIGGKVKGTEEFGGKRTPGMYELRMADGDGNEVAYSDPFYIGDDPVKPTSLKTDKKEYLPQEPIKLSYPAHKGGMRIVLLSAKVPRGSSKINATNSLSNTYIYGNTSGVAKKKAPKKLGKYEFRAQESEHQLGSVAFEVVAKRRKKKDERQVWLDKTQVRKGQKIPFHYTSVSFQNVRIYLVRTEVPRGNTKITYDHMESAISLYNHTHGSGHYTTSKPGEYELRMDDGNGNEVAYSKKTVIVR